MIYDCFTFFNELDLLEVRLRTLDSVVDRFVLCEAGETFSGQKKPLYFGLNAKRFSPWRDKITRVIAILPKTENRWEREYYQRNALSLGYLSALPDDLIMISDVDEIPYPRVVMALDDQVGNGHFVPTSLGMKTFYWNLHTVSEQALTGTCVMTGMSASPPQNLRDIRHVIRHIPSSCWHFSFFPNLDENPVHAAQRKIKSFAHGEFDTVWGHDVDRLTNAVSYNEDPFGRNEFPTRQENPTDLPLCLYEEFNRYEAWWK